MNDVSVAKKGSRQCAGYTLIEKLGEGGQGEVWRARDTARGTDVALKVLSPSLARSESAWELLEREYSIAQHLDHPGILKVYPPRRDANAAVLPTELAAGGDLSKLRGASYLDIVPALIETAQALEHAHERGIIHRDLKPSNVLRDAQGRVRVADFGVAGAVGSQSASHSTVPITSLASSSRGNANWVALPAGLSPFSASPAQLRGEPATVADDIYGLGALAYELLSGYPPYHPNFDLQRALEEPVPELRPVQLAPPRLAKFIMRMLAKEPARRPRSMREVIDALDLTLNDTLTFAQKPEESSLDRTMVFDAPLPPPVPTRTVVVEPPAQRPTLIVAPPASDAPSLAPLRPAATQPIQGVAPPATAEAPPVTPPRRREPPRVDPYTYVEPEPLHVASTAPTATPPMMATPASTTRAPEPPFYSRAEPAPLPWGDIKIEAVPGLMRIEPEPVRRWPWLLMAAVMIAAVVGVFFWLPEFAPTDTVATTTAPVTPTPAPDAVQEAPPAVTAARQPSPEEPATQAPAQTPVPVAGTRASPGVAAPIDDATTASTEETQENAQQKLEEFTRSVQLKAQLDAAERALEAGQPDAARQAYENVLRLQPGHAGAEEGLRRARNLSGILPLLADGANAEAAGDFKRAAQDYSQVLALDPKNSKARAGLARANASFGEDTYAKAVGEGYAALGAGRLEQARTAFEDARKVKPSGPEANEGLTRVGAALRARGFASTRARAAALEGEERWSEALQEYEGALRVDPSLAFAQEGRTRASARAQLATRLQTLIDRPERLSSEAVRSEAQALLREARSQSLSGPVLRSQIARLELLLPEFDQPVRLALVSDNATQVAIQRVGAFGTFTRRDIELKPGRYTVVGTRPGFRDVRRDVTVAPGQQEQTINITCVEPI